MPLSWTEIRDRATQFKKRWANTDSEQAESQAGPTQGDLGRVLALRPPKFSNSDDFS
jgi:hypothetical protein